VVGDHAYVAGLSRTETGLDRGRLDVIDISDPTNPQAVGQAFTGGRGYQSNVAISGNYALVSDWNWDPSGSGLLIFDISDPTAPRRVGAVRSISSAWYVVTQDMYAYVASYVTDGGSSEFVVLDLANPLDPQRVGSVEFPDLGENTQILISGQYAYLNAGQGVRVIDISDPTNPSVVGSYGADLSFDESLLFSMDVAGSGDYLYVAEGNWMLRVLQMSTVPENVPLSVESEVGALILKWPATATAYLLESSADPTAPIWDPVAGTTQSNGDQYEITVPADGPARFFRLRKP
jgi:hypothetical protein